MPKLDELSEKQEKFCQEVAAGASYTDAALRAGYSPNTAWNTGWQNMQKRYIRGRVAELQGVVAQDFKHLIEPAVKTLYLVMVSPGVAESARIAAAQTILKLTGAMVERTESKVTTTNLSPEGQELHDKLIKTANE